MECAVDARNTTGESPLWSAREGALYWVDIPAGAIHRWRPATSEQETWRLPAAVGSITRRGGLVAAMRNGFHLFDTEPNADLPRKPEPDVPTNRLNDGKVSRRTFLGGHDGRTPGEQPVGSLYRLDVDHRSTRMAGDVKVRMASRGVRMAARCITRFARRDDLSLRVHPDTGAPENARSSSECRLTGVVRTAARRTRRDAIGAGHLGRPDQPIQPSGA